MAPGPYGPRALWSPGPMAPGPMAPGHYGPRALWPLGPMAPWALWPAGPMAPGPYGPRALWPPAHMFIFLCIYIYIYIYIQIFIYIWEKFKIENSKNSIFYLVLCISSIINVLYFRFFSFYIFDYSF